MKHYHQKMRHKKISVHCEHTQKKLMKPILHFPLWVLVSSRMILEWEQFSWMGRVPCSLLVSPHWLKCTMPVLIFTNDPSCCINVDNHAKVNRSQVFSRCYIQWDEVSLTMQSIILFMSQHTTWMIIVPKIKNAISLPPSKFLFKQANTKKITIQF